MFHDLTVAVVGFVCRPWAGLAQFVARGMAESMFRRFAQLESHVRILPTARIENLARDPGRISIGHGTVVRGQLLVFAHAGEIRIGADCYIGEDTRIWSSHAVRIGNRVLVSHNVNIHDTDAHPRDAKLRHQHYLELLAHGHSQQDPGILAAPLVIGDDVWVGFNASILKGVTIGDRSIVAACSVVTHDVPAGVIVAGNPAKVIRTL
jgi:acetyltransferase-like isoleucine patch superfamily enzyme